MPVRPPASLALRAITRLAAAARVALTLATIGALVAGSGAVLTRDTARAARPSPAPSAAPAAADPLRTADVSRAGTRTPRPTRPTDPKVAPLRHLVTPDVRVTLPRSVTARQLAALRAAAGVTAVTAVDTGTVRTPQGVLDAVGVDPSQFRAFTPRLTARSDALWRSVARGEATLSFAKAGRFTKLLGTEVPMSRGSHVTPVRLGAFASLGLPDVAVVIDHARAEDLRLARGRGLLVAAPTLPFNDITGVVRRVLGAGARVMLLRPAAVDQSLISRYAASVIPAGYLRLYRAAATTCQGLPWAVLAAIGAVETGHGTNVAVSSAGAMGPMQFMPDTWRAYGIDADHDGKADIMDPVDAVYSAARYLCASGAGRGGQSLYEAIFAYNHADWYVREVVALALRYQ